MGYNQENFRRIREEYSRKYLQVQEAASKRREEIHAILPEIKEIDSLLSDMGLRIMQAAFSAFGAQRQQDEQNDNTQQADQFVTHCPSSSPLAGIFFSALKAIISRHMVHNTPTTPPSIPMAMSATKGHSGIFSRE